MERRSAAAEIAIGINFGTVWAKRLKSGFETHGYAINLAKRIESHSRDGQHFRIFLSDTAYNLLHARMRNLLFSEREFASGKGILGQFGVYEIVDAFVDSVDRLAPEIAKLFEELVEAAIDSTSRDLWIHSAYQVYSEKLHGVVTDNAAALPKRAQLSTGQCGGPVLPRPVSPGAGGPGPCRNFLPATSECMAPFRTWASSVW